MDYTTTCPNCESDARFTTDPCLPPEMGNVECESPVCNFVECEVFPEGV